MKKAVAVMGTVSMMAMLAACGAVEPQAGTYDVQVDVSANADEGTLVSRVVILDSVGQVVAQEETASMEVTPGFDPDEILEKLRVDVRLDGPPDFNPEPDPMTATSQTLSNDGWGSFTGKIAQRFDGEFGLEVTVSVPSEEEQEVYEMVYLPILDARRAGVAADWAE